MDMKLKRMLAAAPAPVQEIFETLIGSWEGV